MPNFSPEELELLKKYVTDPTGKVFAVKNMPGMVGAAYARYSRAKGGFREVLLKEFIQEGVVDPEHAAELIERILIAFGDDSVGELEGAHLSFEEISMVATKEIEECRIGGSPIEQSTRYVFYDQKDTDGGFRYFTPPGIAASMHAPAYRETMDFLFTTYTDLIEPMKAFYEKLKPIESAEYDVLGSGTKQKFAELSEEKDRKAFKKTYTMDLRTRACDTLRYILPLSTRTNVGLFGNGRFYQGLISALLSSPLPEAKSLGADAFRELTKIIPAYVRRAKANDYQMTIERDMQTLADAFFENIEPETPKAEISLLDQGEERLAKLLRGKTMSPELIHDVLNRRFDSLTIGLMLYPYARHPLAQIIRLVDELTPDQREAIFRTYVGKRGTRRDRPYRALEAGYPYTFDLITDFGTYKDLMRHRMNSQLRQRFSPRLGFSMPADLVEAGFEQQALACHERSLALYDQLEPDFPVEAQYAALHGSKIRWVIAMNEREAYHLLELRTTPQGHPSYRLASQRMHKLIEARSPFRAGLMSFVDHNTYHWARGDAEAKQRVKEKAFDEKGRA
jgi:thymidylate synthase ThyX